MRLLMCSPEHFDVTYEINDWMRIANGPDPETSRQQWQALYTVLREEVGADVALVPPQPGLPDMVFTANAGLTKGDVFVPSRFRPIERQGEVAFFIQWMLENGFRLQPLTEAVAGHLRERATRSSMVACYWQAMDSGRMSRLAVGWGICWGWRSCRCA